MPACSDRCQLPSELMMSKSLKYTLFFVLLAMLPCGLLLARQGTLFRGGIVFSLANAELIEWDGESYFSLDVMASSPDSDQRLGTGIILLNYNPEVFGYNVRTNNNVIVTQGDLVHGVPFSFYYLIINDNTCSRLAVTYEYLYSAGQGGLLASTPQQLVNIKLRVLSTGHNAGMSFQQNMMANQQYWDDNATLFDPVMATDTENSLIPPRPQNLILIQSGDDISLQWDQISGCSYSVHSSVDPMSDNWLLEASGLTEPAWGQAMANDRKFFRVTATGTPY